MWTVYRKRKEEICCHHFSNNNIMCRVQLSHIETLSQKENTRSLEEFVKILCVYLFS